MAETTHAKLPTKHARITTKTPQTDGSRLVEVESYFEELNSFEQSVEKSLITDSDHLAADLISCLDVVSSGEALGLELRIVFNKQTKKPERIVKVWTIVKENYR